MTFCRVACPETHRPAPLGPAPLSPVPLGPVTHRHEVALYFGLRRYILRATLAHVIVVYTCWLRLLSATWQPAGFPLCASQSASKERGLRKHLGQRQTVPFSIHSQSHRHSSILHESREVPDCLPKLAVSEQSAGVSAPL